MQETVRMRSVLSGGANGQSILDSLKGGAQHCPGRRKNLAIKRLAKSEHKKDRIGILMVI